MFKKCLLVLSICSIICGSANAAPKNNDFARGVQLYKSGDYIKALSLFKKVTYTDPSNALAHYYLAMCNVKFGQIDEAKSEYRQVIKLNEKAAIALYAAKGLDYLGEKTNLSKDEGKEQNNNNSQYGNLPNMPSSNSSYNPATMNPPGYISAEEVAKMNKKIQEQQRMYHPPVYYPPSSNTPPTSSNVPKNNPSVPQQIFTPPPSNYMPTSSSNYNKSSNEVEQTNKTDEVKTANIEKETKEVIADKKTTDNNQEEIKKALEVLSKAGMGNNTNINPEMMQLQMMMGSMGGFGGNSGMGANPMAAMMPMLMAQYANKSSNNNGEDSGINAALMQTMMTNMMMPSMFSQDNNNGGGGGFNF